MSCKNIQRELLPMINGEVSEQRSKEINGQLASCSDKRRCNACKVKIAEYIAIKKAMSSVPPAHIPSHVHHSILDQIRLIEYHKQGIDTQKQWRLIPIMMMTVFILFLGSKVGLKILNTTSNLRSDSAEFFELRDGGLADVFALQEVNNEN